MHTTFMHIPMSFTVHTNSHLNDLQIIELET